MTGRPSAPDAHKLAAGTLSLPLTLAILSCAALLGIAGALRHEWWRDEATTVLVLRQSSSLSAYCANLGTNGHPRLYYILTYLLYRLWPSLIVLALANLAIALGAIALLVRSAPFSATQKALFSLGFYPLYQYGLIVRSYSLFVFLLFLWAYCKQRWPARSARRLVVIALLAQIHVMATAAAGALLLCEWRESRGRWTRTDIAAACLAAMSPFLVAWQVMPHGGSRISPPLNPLILFTALSNAFVPGFGSLHAFPLQLPVGIGLGLLSFHLLRPQREAWLRYVLLSASLTAVLFLLYSGFRWHHGLLFLYFVVALWTCDGALPKDRVVVRYVTVVFGLHALIGLYALGEDLVSPYSNGQAVAAELQREDLRSRPLVGVSVTAGKNDIEEYRFNVDQTQPVLLYAPGKQVYDPRIGSFVPYWSHYDSPDYFPKIDEQTMEHTLRELSARMQETPLLVVFLVSDESWLERVVTRLSARFGDHPQVLPAKPPPFAPPSWMRKVADFPATLDFGEHFGLYEYRKDGGAPAAGSGASGP